MNQSKPINLSSTDEAVLDFTSSGKHYEMLQDDSFVVSRLLGRIQKRLSNNTTSMNANDAEKIVGEGMRCKLLVPGSSQWLSGKVRLVLEFQPDEPEEPVETVPGAEA